MTAQHYTKQKVDLKSSLNSLYIYGVRKLNALIFGLLIWIEKSGHFLEFEFGCLLKSGLNFSLQGNIAFFVGFLMMYSRVYGDKRLGRY